MITSFENALGELFVTARGLGGPARGRVTNDSRKVLPGDIFVAIPGSRFDAHDFIDQAINARAQVIVHERNLKHYQEKTTYIQVTDAGRWSLPGRAMWC